MRGIKLDPNQISAQVFGVNEVVDKMPLLTTIRIHYDLKIPEGSKDVVDRALERHVQKCPTAKSLEGAVAVEWSADITELPAETQAS